VSRLEGAVGPPRRGVLSGLTVCCIAKPDSVLLWRCITVAWIKVKEYMKGKCTIRSKWSPVFTHLVGGITNFIANLCHWSLLASLVAKSSWQVWSMVSVWFCSEPQFLLVAVIPQTCHPMADVPQSNEKELLGPSMTFHSYDVMFSSTSCFVVEIAWLFLHTNASQFMTYL